MNQKIVAINIDGQYPLAINISETDGLLLHSKGQVKFTINGLIPSSSSNHSLLYTDQYSTLFQLSDSFFVLVSKDTMTITIFDNNLIEQIPKNTTVFPKAISMERYKYSIISTTQFVITYDTNSYSCVINNQQLEIDPLNILNGVTDANNLSCDYLKLYNVLVCTYTDNLNIISFTVYNLTTNRVSIPNYLGISFTDAYYPIIKGNKNLNTFSLCYYLINYRQSLKQFNCHKLNVIKENEEFKISTITTFYSNSIAQQSLTGHDIKYIQNNFFVIHNTGTSLLHNHLSPSNMKISPTKTIDCNDCDYPFLYSIELSVGYVYHSSGLIQIEVYTHPKCPSNPVMSTQISSFGSVSINYVSPHYFTFYEYPNNSILLQNKEYINPNTSYTKGEFDYINYHLTGDATWLYSVNTTSVVNSLLCELTLLICYNTCSECVQGIYGDSTNHTCKQCIDNYYKYYDFQSELGNCTSKEEKNHKYYLDGDVFKPCHESCASCLKEENNNTNCLSCADTYYPLEEDLRQCKMNNIENYFLSNNIILKRCYESCKTCSEVGFPESHNCIECKEGYAKGVTNLTYCYTKCAPDPTMPTNNSDICINSTNPCPGDFFSIYGTNECVKRCSAINNRDCLACQKTSYFKYKFNEASNFFCVENCPKGNAKQYGVGEADNECIQTGGTNETSDRLKIYIEAKASTNFNKVEYNASDINQYLTNLTTLGEEKNSVINLISFVIGNDYSLTYFNVNDEDLKNRVSYNKSKKVSAIDYNSFINSINAKNSENTTTVDATNAIPPIDANQIFAMQWDIPRPNELTSQVRYKLFYSNGNEYNTRSFQQQPINISYHITNLDDPILQNAIMLGKLGINMYNASSPFYNDVCFIYQDNITGRDVSVRDRVEAFYPKTEICESSCQLLSIDVDNQKAICQCPFDDSFSNEIVVNKPFPQLNQSNVESYNVVKCVYTAFDKESIVHNVSFWLFLVFIVIIVVLILCFIYSGMGYANSYVSKILKTKNTPNPNTVNVYRSNNNNIINHDNDEKLNLSSDQ